MNQDGMPAHIREHFATALPDGQLSDRMGIVVTEWAPDRLVATMPVEGNRQPFGLLHGGASCALVETLGSLAAAVHAGPGRIALGVEINASHHRPAGSGVVTGVCTPLHAGRTMATYEIVITDEAGQRICTARFTCVIRPADGPAPRSQ